MKIGVIGSGRIGGTLGTLWARAGHQVLFSSRHPDRLDNLVARAGSTASRGTVAEAARFGEVVLTAVPLLALPALGQALAADLHGKILLDVANPYPERDGDIARTVIDSGRGTGPFVAAWFPGVRVVRAFNTVWDKTLVKEAHRAPPRIGIPLASNDLAALEVAAALVRDAGFDPVIVGSLARSKEFDVGSPVYNTAMTAAELRSALHLTREFRGRPDARPESTA
jgi:8-hydroxy-5-deazaflavin:NADPH oxidoreductase